MKSYLLNLSLTQYIALRSFSKLNGISISKIIRRGIDLALEEYFTEVVSKSTDKRLKQ